WDCATQGLPPLDVLGDYRVVLWHADDFSQNLLIDHQNTLGGYILGGGRVLLSGWKTASVLSDSFFSRFAPGVQLTYDNAASLISAESNLYADLAVDPLKTTASWNGMLPQIYTFTDAQNPLYTATMSPTAAGNGQVAAFRHDIQPSGGRLIMFGFPLYFMQADGVRALLQSIIPHMDPSMATDDNAIPALTASLSVYPNPFNPSTTIGFSLSRPAFVELDVYNLKGQKVRKLLAGETNAGSHSALFDGRDDRGRELSTGIYLLRMKYDNHLMMSKISLIK
ncbi:MAG: FlgD immunoglobulin-like domain containing protein, partial [Actinomycetota bacterium]|nr:FlgD immunoglobulin-like domain containing protein [Actinomycetota bacterium]